MRLHAVAVCIISWAAAAQEVAPGKLLIRTSADEAVITIDGETRGLAPRTETLAPGVHTIVAETKDAPPVSQTVSLTSGETRTLTLSFIPPARARPFPTVGTVMVATGGLIVAGGLLLRGPAEEAARKTSAAFQRGGGWDEFAQRLEHNGLVAETWSWLLLGLGVTTVVSGVVVGVLEHFGTPESGPKLVLAPIRGGAWVGGVFTW